MDVIQALVLALIQGLTEFLPISSSAHLILPAQMFGWPDQGLAFDVAVHVGSLAAVMIYFRNDIRPLFVNWIGSFAGTSNEHSRLAWFIIIGTIPAVVFGFLFDDFVSEKLRATWVIATTTILFGLLLWYADRRPSERRDIVDLTLKMVVIIGLAQALALIPGTSRSGITMTAALLLGMNRVASARFSFLLSIPLIAAAGSYKSLQLVSEAGPVEWLPMLVGVVMSFVSAYACIYVFLAAINRIGMLPFVIYRLVLGAILFAFFV